MVSLLSSILISDNNHSTLSIFQEEINNINRSIRFSILSLSLLDYPSDKHLTPTSTPSFVNRTNPSRNWTRYKSAPLPKRETIFRIRSASIQFERFYLVDANTGKGEEGEKNTGLSDERYNRRPRFVGWRHDASCDGGRSTPDKPRQLFRVIARRESYGPLAGFINRGND